MEFGIRAMCRILLTYKQRDIVTVSSIISTWAPPSDGNDTASYISHVCEKLEVGPNDTINVDNAETMRPLIEAITLHENGIMPLTKQQIDDGMRLAGVQDVKAAPVMSTNGGKGITVATVSTTVAAAGEGVRQLQDVRETVDQSFDLGTWLLHFGPSIAIVFVLAGVGLFAWDWYSKRKRLGV